MATALMSQPCGDACNQEAEYKVTFMVTSLEMTDKDKAKLFDDVLIVVTWDGNVMKLSETENAETFNRGMDWILLSSPENLSKKLKFSPIMIDLSRACTELGTIKMTLSDCFSDAVSCGEFNSQTVVSEFKFVKDDVENATLNAYFRVQKLLDDGVTGVLLKQLTTQVKTRMNQAAKSKKKADKEDDDCPSESEDESCKEFACPDELAEHCKKSLTENVYRIINGILINTKDKTGPCGGVECPVAGKYIKELCKKSPEEGQPSKRFQFQEPSKCADLFNWCCCDCKFKPNASEICCPECGGQVTDKPASIAKASPQRKPCKDDWIERNIREEDLLKKLCDKYGIKVEDIKAVGQPIDLKACNKKDKKKKKVKRVKKSCVTGGETVE